jgi:hypothetical protein
LSAGRGSLPRSRRPWGGRTAARRRWSSWGGEAGVGKTRPVTEFAARQAGTGARVLVGGCVPFADGELPFAPAVEALRDLVGQVGAEPVRTLAGPSWPELARLLPALGGPDRAGPAPTPEPTDQLRLFELLLGLLGALAEEAALVVVVEDVHWADRSTRDLLAFLARNLRRRRVVLVVTHRSDESGRRWLGPLLAELGRAGAERLELDRLGRAESAAQMAAILGAAPPADLLDGVFARAEGNPFFTEELLAAALAGPGALPASLHDLLRGRIQAVSEPARQALRVAAVVGRRAPHRLLAAVAGLDDPRLGVRNGRKLLLRYTTTQGVRLREQAGELLQTSSRGSASTWSCARRPLRRCSSTSCPTAGSTSPRSPGSAARPPSRATGTPTSPGVAATTAGSAIPRSTSCSSGRSPSSTRTGRRRSPTRSTAGSGRGCPASPSTSGRRSSPGATPSGT